MELETCEVGIGVEILLEWLVISEIVVCKVDSDTVDGIVSGKLEVAYNEDIDELECELDSDGATVPGVIFWVDEDNLDGSVLGKVDLELDLEVPENVVKEMRDVFVRCCVVYFVVDIQPGEKPFIDILTWLVGLLSVVDIIIISILDISFSTVIFIFDNIISLIIEFDPFNLVIILLESSYIFKIYSLIFEFLSTNSNSKNFLSCSGVKVTTITTGIVLKFAPLLFGKNFSWNINGSDCISVIYLGFPINSIRLHAFKN